VGNVFLGDDAFGVEVVRCSVSSRAARAWKSATSASAASTWPMNCSTAATCFVLIDAAPRGEPPGTVSVVDVQLPDPAR